MTAQADEYHYEYVSFDDVLLPEGFDTFEPLAIDDKGRVYGNLYAGDTYRDFYIAVYDEGNVTILQPRDLSKFVGTSLVVNKRGTVGGSVYEPDFIGTQAALFRKKKVELIPKLPGAGRETVVSINDSNTALVWSEVSTQDIFFNRNKYRLYKNGKTTFQYQLPVGSDCTRCWGVNNQGVVAGVIFDPDLDAFRAIRFQPPYDKPRLLDPLPSDAWSEARGINNKGDVLGVSTNDPFGNPTYSIGIWNRKGDFEPFSVDSNYYSAIFNDRKLIVLSQNYEDYKAYLVPEPGLRLNLEDLVVNPASMEGLAPLLDVLAINNRGDMIGFGVFDEASFDVTGFLLQRIKHGRPHGRAHQRH